MEINVETYGAREPVKDVLQVCYPIDVVFYQDECVVRMLEDRTGEGGIDGVVDQTIGGGLLQQALQDVCNNDEEVWRDGVALPESMTSLKPVTRVPFRRMDVLSMRRVQEIQSHHKSPKPRARMI